MFQSGKPDLGWLLLGMALAVFFAGQALSSGDAAALLWRTGRRRSSLGIWLDFVWECFWTLALTLGAIGAAFLTLATAVGLVLLLWRGS